MNRAGGDLGADAVVFCECSNWDVVVDKIRVLSSRDPTSVTLNPERIDQMRRRNRWTYALRPRTWRNVHAQGAL
jgi:hypothetical protein